MSPSEHRKSDVTYNLLTHHLAGVALRIYLGVHGLVGWGGLELGDISPLGYSELALGDFEIIRSVTCSEKSRIFFRFARHWE